MNSNAGVTDEVLFADEGDFDDFDDDANFDDLNLEFDEKAP